MESYGYRTDDIVLQASDSEQFLFNADTQHLDTGNILYSIEMDVEYTWQGKIVVNIGR